MSDSGAFFKKVRRPKASLTVEGRRRLFWAAIVVSVAFIVALWLLVLPTQLRNGQRNDKALPWQVLRESPETQNFEQSLQQLKTRINTLVSKPPEEPVSVDVPAGLVDLPDALQQKGEKLITDHSDETAQPQE